MLMPAMVSGCVGIGPITTRVNVEHISPPTQRYVTACPKPQERGKVEFCPAQTAASVTREQIQTLWGKPKETGSSDGHDFMTYNRDLAWRGLMVFLIVPIPLLLPVGYNETTFFFEKERLVKVHSDDWKSDIALCGLHSTGPDGFGCRTGW
jgi:hypothetical protein